MLDTLFHIYIVYTFINLILIGKKVNRNNHNINSNFEPVRLAALLFFGIPLYLIYKDKIFN